MLPAFSFYHQHFSSRYVYILLTYNKAYHSHRHHHHHHRQPWMWTVSESTSKSSMKEFIWGFLLPRPSISSISSVSLAFQHSHSAFKSSLINAGSDSSLPIVCEREKKHTISPMHSLKRDYMQLYTVYAVFSWYCTLESGMALFAVLSFSLVPSSMQYSLPFRRKKTVFYSITCIRFCFFIVTLNS